MGERKGVELIYETQRFLHWVVFFRLLTLHLEDRVPQ